jgi:hypothetical protein
MIITYPVNESLAGIVPMPSKIEQDALTADIQTKGLLTPVVLWRGQIIDGRCRQVACAATDTEIRTESLDWDMAEDKVKDIVQSLNIRRNLTITQKAMTAFKVYIASKGNKKLYESGKEWGISERTMKAVNYIYKQTPELLEPLFNGDSVMIKDMKGNAISSNKINSICQYLKRIEEEKRLLVVETISHEWSEDTYIITQKGKDWYKSFVDMHSIKDVQIRIAISELANYKFPLATSL